MKRIIRSLAIIVFCMALRFVYSIPSADGKEEITIVIPAKVLAECINDVLPIEIATKENVQGVIRIEKIDELQLGLDTISFMASIHGTDVGYTGKIADLPASIRVGNIDTSCRCVASIRYDRETYILYVKPTLREGGEERGLLWPLLMALLGEREYPIEIQRLRPIVAKVSNRAVTIDMEISDIYTVPNRLFIALSPRISSRDE
jgi:hypothetical protein